jgi:MFS superfamily sulfate permease-like transporter
MTLRFPPAYWLPDYRPVWLGSDFVAGVTLAAYAIPVSLAYAGLLQACLRRPAFMATCSVGWATPCLVRRGN